MKESLSEDSLRGTLDALTRFYSGNERTKQLKILFLGCVEHGCLDFAREVMLELPEPERTEALDVLDSLG